MNTAQDFWQSQITKCIRCGTCRSVCPVFKSTHTENSTARGKVKLIESVADGKLELTPGMQERMTKCLLCKACVAGCPSGVKTDDLFLSARRVLAEKNGLPWAKKAAFTALTYRRLFDMGLRLGSVFQNLVLKDAPSGRGKQARFPLPAAGLTDRRILPSLPPRPLRGLVPPVSTVEKPRARVAFFPGCMLSYIYPDAGKAVVDILTANNVEVVLPEELFCCGTPAFTSGDFKAGQYLAERNVETLSSLRCDAIITACASCGTALKQEYGHVIENQASLDKWSKLSEKVIDVSQYLVQTGYDTNFGEVQAKVTYHDPCHLVRGLKVAKEPRELIKAIPGVEFTEMKDAAVCCGCGGSFSLVYYDVSRDINEQKLKNIADSKAELLVTGCPACRMHITDGLEQSGSPVTVTHTAQLIARSYQAAKQRV